MRSVTVIRISLLLAALVVLSGGCAYYNTFYNARRKFAEAERETERAQRQQPQPRPGESQSASQLPRQVPVDKYRKVIETSARLLENYPKSKWVDDALFLMGVSYYRLNDLPRAERKFTELTTLFPKSPHAPAAVIWKARTLADQNRPDDAIELLAGAIVKLRDGSPEKAEALYRLARLHYERAEWGEAAVRYRECLQQRQSREQRMTTLYECGISEYRRGEFGSARTVLAEVARGSRLLSQAFDAYVYWSRSEAALGNTAEAEIILTRVRASERFLDFADRADLELARLAAQTGRLDDAVAMYEAFIMTHDNGELRGLAFYRLANIYREQRVNLPLSKALLDSAVRCGAVKEIADSARTALTQISKGLVALERIGGLLEQIQALQSPSGEPPPRPAPVDAAQTKSVESRTLDGTDEPRDSTENRPQDGSEGIPADGKRLTPAALAADSILNALREQSQREQAAGSAGSVQSLTQLQRELQLAYLHIAEFYAFSLADHDSALHYYRIAARDPVNASAYWRANLYLARLAAGTDSNSPEAEIHYRAVLSADSVPLSAVNEARAALHLPLLEEPVPPQRAALHAAERAAAKEGASPDSALQLYSMVVALDSTTPEAQTALFARAHIFEEVLFQRDSARVIYEELMRLHPQAEWLSTLRRKLAPPDTQSVFNASDEELYGASGESVQAILQPTEGTRGWPPPEESLRGRRYR